MREKRFLGGSEGKELACHAGPQGLTPGLGKPLEKGMATHSSILAWRIPWSLVDYSPWGRKELDMTEQLTLLYFHERSVLIST